ncbi:tripartite tricarboxylate transporter permease [Aquiluna borgnonia]|uniref:Tripartite tricarboxylate transporter permease n=1 Tax=Aquiluna borgnonia TaxID=2499157 RepID=A0A7D4TS50_9MICO|nr:tripartite tricarboxylate transporter permease [Aquiluna borgnonia]QKJ25833.1 tripartite tricarboxylate transporter permease [Aquiluna borgnonia]
MDWGNFIAGFSASLTFTNLMFGLLGTVLGTLVGVLPGIGPALAISLLLPVTLVVEPTAALIMFAAIYYGAMYGGSTTSILLNTPGESGSVMTAIEGNKMAKRGRAGAALATAAIGSFVAGAIATGLLALGAPFLARIGLMLTPPDYLALIIVAFGTVGAVMGKSPLRGLISLSVGLSIALVGIDSQSGVSRLTFGNMYAADGIETIVIIVSLFAVGETLYVAFRGKFSKGEMNSFKGFAFLSREDWKRSWKPWLRGTAIGFPTGVLPAGGSELPTFLSYSLERRLSKNKEEFGNGAIEGVAGPEAANNANAGGALVPLLALGLPTSGTAAVILASFQQFNINPGPLLFSEQPVLVWTLIASLFLGNLLLLVINLPLVGLWAKLLTIPAPFLYAGIIMFAVVGAYAINNFIFDLWMALAIGVLGLLFRRYGYPITPLILGSILGPMAEIQFRRSLQISYGDYSILVSTPFTIAAYVLLALVIVGTVVLPRMSQKRKALVG